ncbi:MAG: hypothetical protein DRR16_19995 [Candidatus Parabeggiatoa sp. nov. 3]|nr:MAG: hypothetical protein DRR00_17270 [Gammaproteobacteria bacterium]RKZ68760.1 MAG: hypothetical protein DRQ99_02930 [Gammaproteobacteria bacterium]RKZ82302.1 MAG: hypothetical protein DRR16_19995 [Gammaproteobacteria bacterium]HEW98080.1 hypothetical protein [Beggiatoa sp.]
MPAVGCWLLAVGCWLLRLGGCVPALLIAPLFGFCFLHILILCYIYKTSMINRGVIDYVFKLG